MTNALASASRVNQPFDYKYNRDGWISIAINMGSSRKAVLFISKSDSEEDIAKIRDMLLNAGIEFIEYNIDEEPAGCCGGFRTETPSLFAPEGIFRGVDGIVGYIKARMDGSLYSSESAYW
ncbi:protein of unknown function [Candidatus Nitrosocaldus cavascurensis]|uniref:Glutaredoxin n=2 Tax=Candidatus Nitrosocaldaceae TaxID=1968910 RepID=A0A2K5AT28_9ARCH|nr:protein of unknown function [Candidatus Nitrosocaldus cavascurensis]